MTDKLNMALDDIIMKEKKSTGRGNKESRAFSKGAGRGGKKHPVPATPSRAKITKRRDNVRNAPKRGREEKSAMMRKEESSFSQKKGNRQRPFSQQASLSRRGNNRMEVDNHSRTRNLPSKLENYEITIINDRAGRQAPPASSSAPYRSNAMDIYTSHDANSTMTDDDHRARPTEQRHHIPQMTQGLYSSRMQRANGGNNNSYDSNQSIRKP